MKTENKKIKDFWWLNNDECWLIKRENRANYYLYTRTMRYIYKPSWGDKRWRGTKNPFALIMYDKETREKEIAKIKIFDNEDQAVRWLAGENVRVKK